MCAPQAAHGVPEHGPAGREPDPGGGQGGRHGIGRGRGARGRVLGRGCRPLLQLHGHRQSGGGG